MGRKWRSEQRVIKEFWNSKAEQVKIQHRLNYPHYQYQPRKKGEKKRRMTQRKKAALERASSEKSASMALDDFMMPLPDFPMTLGGNPMMELGDENLPGDMLTGMLINHNNTRPQLNNQLATIVANAQPASIFDEPTQEAQYQKNFYNSISPIRSPYAMGDLFNEVNIAQEPMVQWNPDIEKARFDEHQGFNTEMERMSNWEKGLTMLGSDYTA